MAEKKPQPQQMKLDISSEVAKGVYCNLVLVSHTPTEFCIDFAQIFPGSPNQAPVRSRIIMTPFHARNFLNALNDNIRKYENHFGPIPAPQTEMGDSNTIPYDMLPQGEA